MIHFQESQTQVHVNTAILIVIVTLYLFGKNVYVSQSVIMCQIFPHMSCQLSLKRLDNTGLCFRIFSGEEMSKILSIEYQY